MLSHDVTERERAEAMRRDFVANVSHEIRTPLTVLAGFLETLRNLPLTEAEQQRVLTLMAQQAERMQTLVSDLLDAGAARGQPAPGRRPLVGVDACCGAVEAEARALSGRAAHASPSSAPARRRIAGAEAELQSALGNLVSNAVRYTPDGGRIDVAWQRRRQRRAARSPSPTPAPASRASTSRGSPSASTASTAAARARPGGTGLGLAIVKHVVQRHGGELDIDERARQGLDLPARLPRPRCACASTCRRGRRAPAAGDGGRTTL